MSVYHSNVILSIWCHSIIMISFNHSDVIISFLCHSIDTGLFWTCNKEQGRVKFDSGLFHITGAKQPRAKCKNLSDAGSSTAFRNSVKTCLTRGPQQPFRCLDSNVILSFQCHFFNLISFYQYDVIQSFWCHYIILMSFYWHRVILDLVCLVCLVCQIWLGVVPYNRSKTTLC